MDEKIEKMLETTGKCTLSCLVEMIDGLHEARKDGTTEHEGEQVDEEGMREYIQEDPLEVSVRGGYHSPGDEEGAKATEYLILLGTGGPASRIVGDLDQYGEPENARLQVQDWFLPWTDVPTSSEEDEKLLDYASCFFFGE